MKKEEIDAKVKKLAEVNERIKSSKVLNYDDVQEADKLRLELTEHWNVITGTYKSKRFKVEVSSLERVIIKLEKKLTKATKKRNLLLERKEQYSIKSDLWRESKEGVEFERSVAKAINKVTSLEDGISLLKKAINTLQ